MVVNCACALRAERGTLPGFSGLLSTSSMRMREGLKIYTGKRHEDSGKHLKFLLTFCKRSKILITFVHVQNQIQKVVDNGPENPGSVLPLSHAQCTRDMCSREVKFFLSEVVVW